MKTILSDKPIIVYVLGRRHRYPDMIRYMQTRAVHCFTVESFAHAPEVIDRLNAVNDLSELPDVIFTGKLPAKYTGAAVLRSYEQDEGVLIKRAQQL